MLARCRLLGLVCTFIAFIAMAAYSQKPADERNEALQPPKVFLNPAENEYSSHRRHFQGIPGIERAANGRLWVSRFSGSTGEGSTKNYAMLITSADDGRRWSKLKVVVDKPGPVRVFDPCLWIDPLGRLWFFWQQSYRRVDGRFGVWAIVTENPEDANPKWSQPRRLCDGIMLNKPTALSAGDWLLPTSIWRTDNSCRVVASQDEGKTWKLRGTANVPEKYRCPDEPMIVERKDGTLWMLVRNSSGRIGESVSKDGGRTWSDVKPGSIRQPAARFHVRRLRSGNLLLIKHGPIDERIGRERLTAFVSDDDGKSWQGGLLLDGREKVSYPDSTQAADGRIYAVYDRGRYPRTAREILMAVFAEDDVLAGEPSDKTRLRVLVNKAVDP